MRIISLLIAAATFSNAYAQQEMTAHDLYVTCKTDYKFCKNFVNIYAAGFLQGAATQAIATKTKDQFCDAHVPDLADKVISYIEKNRDESNKATGTEVIVANIIKFHHCSNTK